MFVMVKSSLAVERGLFSDFAVAETSLSSGYSVPHLVWEGIVHCLGGMPLQTESDNLYSFLFPMLFTVTVVPLEFPHWGPPCQEALLLVSEYNFTVSRSNALATVLCCLTGVSGISTFSPVSLMRRVFYQ